MLEDECIWDQRENGDLIEWTNSETDYRMVMDASGWSDTIL